MHFQLLVQRRVRQFNNPEFHFYVSMTVIAILLLTAVTWGSQYESIWTALRYSSFQVVSLVSTTGFGTADYLLWGFFAQALLLSLMVIGGSAGSTAGGIKCIRGLLLLKQAKRELYQMIHPRGVIPLKVGKNAVSPAIASAVFGYFFLYVFIFVLATLVLAGTGVELTTSGSAVISALSNIGPGLGEVGPTSNYGHLPDMAKITLSWCMIVGRLEIMTVLVLFTSEFWTS